MRGLIGDVTLEKEVYRRIQEVESKRVYSSIRGKIDCDISFKVTIVQRWRIF